MLQLQNISKQYKTGDLIQHALNGVSLDIHAGKLTGIIGHTGSGKSTLIQLLNGLTRAESGRVLLDGEDIYAPGVDVTLLRKRIFMAKIFNSIKIVEELLMT